MAKEQVTKEQTDMVAEKTVEKVDKSVEKTVEKPEKPSATGTRAKQQKVDKYRLKALMNVRKGPSIEAPIATTLPEGIEVDVKAVEGKWLHLTDGTYILYEGGKWAEKA